MVSSDSLVNATFYLKSDIHVGACIDLEYLLINLANITV